MDAIYFLLASILIAGMALAGLYWYRDRAFSKDEIAKMKWRESNSSWYERLQGVKFLIIFYFVSAFFPFVVLLIFGEEKTNLFGSPQMYVLLLQFPLWAYQQGMRSGGLETNHPPLDKERLSKMREFYGLEISVLLTLVLLFIVAFEVAVRETRGSESRQSCSAQSNNLAHTHEQRSTSINSVGETS